MVKKNWQTKKLGEVCEFIGGGTPSKANKNYWNGNIPWASIKDIKNQYLAQTQDSITDEGLKILPCKPPELFTSIQVPD